MTKIGFIGAGQMATALARGFVKAEQVQGEDIWAFDPAPAALEAFTNAVPGAKAVDDAAKAVAESDVVFLAVKPQHIHSVFRQLSEGNETFDPGGGPLFVSIAAGVAIAKLTAGLGSERVIRVMPNTPCLVGQGASGFCLGAGASEEDSSLVNALLNSVGIAFEVPENQLDAITGLSGSGPAFVYQVVEAMSDGGVRVGLPRAIATQLAAQTVLGAAKMVLETQEHPGVLKDRVASPGGTTIAGLHALERGGLRGTLMNAVEAATSRSKELG